MAETVAAGTSYQNGRARLRAITFVVLAGVMRFFADLTYEGSRSIFLLVRRQRASDAP